MSEKNLFIPLKREYFEAFANGTKHTEYRPFGPRWNHRTCYAGRKVTISLGYGKQSRLEGEIESLLVSIDKTLTPSYIACYGRNTDAKAACIKIKNIRPV